jgi:nitronate monooxygenase
MKDNRLCEMLGIEHPVIMAPMFLVSNEDMIVAALESGITAAFPAMNYRTDEELRAAINNIRSRTDKPFGVNLIVNKSNPKFRKQLNTCVELGVDFFITSLGSPEETIKASKPKGIKVFCDVVNTVYAEKVVALGADALIGVSSAAGGHAGNVPPERLIRNLKEKFDIPVISAGGVATHGEYKHMLELGADGVSVGTVFIASRECKVSDEYKQALIEYGAKDIVRTSNLSGSPLTVINTPYVQKTGTEANMLNRLLYRHKRLKKWLKMLIAVKGMKKIEKAAFGATYKTFYVAGPSIEHIHDIKPVSEIVKRIVKGEEG